MRRTQYEKDLREARRIDDARWKQFEQDTTAQAALEADLHIVIDAIPAEADVSYEQGANYGHA